jgi:hypothetical protein
MNCNFDKTCLAWCESEIDHYDFVMLLPHENPRLRAAFIKKLGDRHGIIIEGEQAEELLRLYSLYAFTDKLIIGSFDLPYGRKLRNLLESGIATEDELIDDVILGAM